MKRLRPIIFWMHLLAGIIAGTAIGIMCFTGASIGFEKQLVAWAERDARQVAVPAADAPRLPLRTLLENARTAKPDARPSAITISADPAAAVTLAYGRDGAVYANPYTGEIRTPASTRMHDFMNLMEDWHRVLALSGDNRPIGKAINGACNLAFFVLAVSGLYLWWPRSWSWRGFKAIAVVNFSSAGKARDFNWHNAIGLWTAPILIVLTLTAVPISYRWGGTLIYQLAGEEPPAAAPGGPSPGGAPATPIVELKRPTPDARPLSQDALIALVQKQFPLWEQITLRTGGNQRGGGRPAGEGAPAQRSEARPAAASSIENPNSKIENPPAAGGERRTPQPVTLTVKVPGTWPRTATTTLTLNPFTGEALKTEGFADLSTARQIRTWTRFLHTGEALGPIGQLIATLACLGGCVLVYTGFALAWRRFFFKSKPAPAATDAA